MNMDELDWMKSPDYRNLKFRDVELGAHIPESFEEPDKLFDILIKELKTYHPSDDLAVIRKAYELAYNAHKDQKRKSGEPYIIHPICVAIILAQLEMDKETIVGGILHDVAEDTDYTIEDIAKIFGDEVALLVDGVTKLTQLNYNADKVERQAENLRKMFLAMAKDIRVIMIKLADRLHNMRTLQFMKPEKQIEKARETMDIYSPIADRLGIAKLKVELDDLSMKYLEPEIYEDLTEKLNSLRVEKETFISQIVRDVSRHIKEAGIEAKIDGRVKHLFSIFKKMKNQNKNIDQIYDLFAVRIIVEDDHTCYAALGVIHEMYKPIPGRFKDYIAMPKPNKYQSLHTTLIGPFGLPFEIQIRTYEMHRVAEYGIAAHWKYKEGVNGEHSIDSEEAKITWLRQILEWQHEMSDNKEFMSLLKSDLDLFSDSVYCFTPNGDVKNLPAGSNPIDFAYSIHSAVGNNMVGVRVNGNIENFDYVIQNGDRIEIITSQNSRGPSRDWLGMVKSTQAKNKINQWFRTAYKEENIARGRELIHDYCKSRGIPINDFLKKEYMDACLQKYGYRNWESLLASIGHGGIKESQVVNRLKEEYNKKNGGEANSPLLESLEKTGQYVPAKNNQGNEHKRKSGIIVEGMDDLAVRFSKCCSPVPGDEIIGFVTRGRGVSIHRTDCINIMNLPEEDRKRLIEAEWRVHDSGMEKETYSTEIVIYSVNRSGLLLELTKVFSERGINVESMNVRTSKNDRATINIGFRVENKEYLRFLVEKIRMVDGVLDIERS
jgi:GTP pyrophosphokinase